MRTIFYFLIIFTLFISDTMLGQELSVYPIISNGMILQQKSDVKIWGTSSPNETIEIKCNWGQSTKTTSNNDGYWVANVKTINAGGPYEISIKNNKKTIIISDVLLGEVWLCSGQSNMEMPVSGWLPNDTIEGSEYEIAHSKNRMIRMFTVQRNVSIEEKKNCEGQWEESSPETTPNFSATAYFFAQKLQAELGVPIGIIHSSWGGTPAEAWVSPKALLTYPDYSDQVKSSQSLIPKINEYENWLNHHKKNTIPSISETEKWKNLEFDDVFCAQSETDDVNWPTLALPCPSWEQNKIGQFDGVVWFRKTIDISKSLNSSDMILHIPGVDDMDRVYINGTLIGATEVLGFWESARNYIIPAKLLTSGKILISIRVIDIQGGGGIGGLGSPFELTSISNPSLHVKLDGDWKYNVAAEYKDNIFYVFDIKANEWMTKPGTPQIGPGTPAALFNAMISPLNLYTIKGALWYQGETNVGRAKQYETLLPLLIKSWRDAWNIGDFPFYMVQIAPWIYSGNKNSEAAELRNAQRIVSENVKNTGIIVTLDLGDITSIHPCKKKQVGERAALWALAKNYTKPITCSGPLYKSSSIIGSKIKVDFDYANNGLLLKDYENNEFQIAGRDLRFIDADVEINGNSLVISNNEIQKPLFVRYAFKNGSKAVLYNKEGLPASTFETK